MVRKRGDDRINKVTSRKRPNNSISESPPSSSSKKDKNILNDRILNMYKNEMTPKRESPLPNSFSSSNEEMLLCDDEKNEESKKVPSIEKRKSSCKNGVGLEKKKSSVLAVKHSNITFKDVGGLDKVLMDVLEIFLHLRDPEVFTRLGIPPVGGFLLHGPPGCGKTHLAQAIAGELKFPYIEVAATELVCGISGESEGKIREMFEEAVKNAPCILFIDEIDAVSPKRETSERGMERRMVAQLLKCLDELNKRDISSSVMVIGATNRPDFIDPALRRGGRFDTEIAIGMPDEKARLAILKVLTEKIKLPSDFDMQWLAHHTPGYVGADLKSLITKAVKVGVRRIYKKITKNYLKGEEDHLQENPVEKSVQLNQSEPNLEAVLLWFKSTWKITDEELENIYFELPDFQVALQNCVPYSKREGFAMVPDVTWDDVGALKDIKKNLQESIIWPVKYAEQFERSGMPSTKGILLYGPKGCGKTLLAKAIANECSINFLSVKGPELLSMYLGESEKAVRQCFQRARNSAPCVIFFDEFDALCPKRSNSNTNAAAERVVNQLLTEMDGMEERKQVFVIGATNRLEKIDSAMLRPGRLEKKIYVDLPSPDDRVEILISLTKNKTRPKIKDDVDLKVIGTDTRCDNFSGADMAYLLRAAFSKALKDRITSSNSELDEDIEIGLEHFEHALSIVKPSISEKDKEYFQQNLLQS